MGRKKQYVTMSDIAKDLGVSVNTVSRALRGKDDISEGMRKRIEERAKEMGFIRNTFASSLRTNQTNILGVILEDSSNPFFSEVFKGIEEAAQKQNYQLILMNSKEDYKTEKAAIDILLSRRVDGLIISPVEKNYEDLKKLEESNFPMLIIGRYIKELQKSDQIYSDDYKGGYLAAKHFTQGGKTNPLALMINTTNSTSQYRLKGFEDGLKKEGLELNKAHKKFLLEKAAGTDYFISDSDISLQYAFNTVETMIKSQKKFDAIFCFNDMMALGVLKALKKHHIKCPEDVSVIGFDDIFFASLSTPSLTTLRIKKHTLGVKAFQMIMDRITKKRTTQRLEKLDVELINRESTSLGVAPKS
jgi:LacI family transcriptional regulator